MYIPPEACAGQRARLTQQLYALEVAFAAVSRPICDVTIR
jgi:hypothetical protein